MGTLRDLTGQRFGRLIVEGRGENVRNEAGWRCRCACGNKTLTPAYALKSGRTQSCGCLHKERASAAFRKTKTTHGATGTPTYRSWRSMIHRCETPSIPSFKAYSAAGITVCARWRASFENFLSDMGERPAGTSIDREDGSRGYEPGNCRWATASEQQNNKSNNVLATKDGRTQTIGQWAAELGVDHSLIYNRLRRGWSAERAISTERAKPFGR